MNFTEDKVGAGPLSSKKAECAKIMQYLRYFKYLWRKPNVCCRTGAMNPNELGPPFDAQINVKMTKAMQNRLLAIENKHGIPAPEILRRLGNAAAEFFEENHWFTFPVQIIPEEFQKKTAEAKAAAANEKNKRVQTERRIIREIRGTGELPQHAVDVVKRKLLDIPLQPKKSRGKNRTK